MLALLLMAMPENSVSKGTLHLKDEATERQCEHIQARYNEGVAPCSWWGGAPRTMPQPCLLRTSQA